MDSPVGTCTCQSEAAEVEKAKRKKRKNARLVWQSIASKR